MKENENHTEDMEVLGIIARKHDLQRQDREKAAKALSDQQEEIRRQETEAQEEWEEGRQDFHRAALIGGVTCAVGGLFIWGQLNSALGWTVGGIFVILGLIIVGIGLAVWRWNQW